MKSCTPAADVYWPEIVGPEGAVQVQAKLLLPGVLPLIVQAPPAELATEIVLVELTVMVEVWACNRA